MAIAVVADADTLFGATTRGLLIHLDYAGLIHLHWSDLILDEMSRALVATGRKADLAAAKANEALMQASLPQAHVSTAEVQAEFSKVAAGMRSAKDTHVAACAKALLTEKYYPDRKVMLVTKNVKDFKVSALATQDIMVRRPDTFLLALWNSDQAGLARSFKAFRLGLKSRPDQPALLEKLAADGQAAVAAAMLVAARIGTADL